MSKEVIEYIWKKIYSVKDKNKSPVYYEGRISNFLESKNQSKEFYPYFKVNFSMMKILEKSKNYISIEDKFSIYVENSITVEPKGIYKSSLKEIYSKIKIMKESFNEKQVVFKSFEKGDKDFCYIERDKINFSSLKLTEPINTVLFNIIYQIELHIKIHMTIIKKLLCRPSLPKFFYFFYKSI